MRRQQTIQHSTTSEYKKAEQQQKPQCQSDTMEMPQPQLQKQIRLHKLTLRTLSPLQPATAIHLARLRITQRTRLGDTDIALPITERTDQYGISFNSYDREESLIR